MSSYTGCIDLDYHLDYAVLKALNRMRMNSPAIVVDPDSCGGNHERAGEYDRLTARKHGLGASA